MFSNHVVKGKAKVRDKGSIKGICDHHCQWVRDESEGKAKVRDKGSIKGICDHHCQWVRDESEGQG